MREATCGNLAHCDSSNHLHGIRGSGLSELPAGLCDSLVFGRPGFGGILILAVQAHLLKGAPPAALAWPAGAARLSIASTAAALPSVSATISSAGSWARAVIRRGRGCIRCGRSGAARGWRAGWRGLHVLIYRRCARSLGRILRRRRRGNRSQCAYVHFQIDGRFLAGS